MNIKPVAVWKSITDDVAGVDGADGNTVWVGSIGSEGSL
jgi:hypothetical protein